MRRAPSVPAPRTRTHRRRPLTKEKTKDNELEEEEYVEEMDEDAEDDDDDEELDDDDEEEEDEEEDEESQKHEFRLLSKTTKSSQDAPYGDVRKIGTLHHR